MDDENILKGYDSFELGEKYISTYKKMKTYEDGERSFGLGFGFVGKYSGRLDEIVEEFRDRDFEERLEVYHSILEVIENSKRGKDKKMTKSFEKMGKHFYRTILD